VCAESAQLLPRRHLTRAARETPLRQGGQTLAVVRAKGHSQRTLTKRHPRWAGASHNVPSANDAPSAGVSTRYQYLFANLLGGVSEGVQVLLLHRFSQSSGDKKRYGGRTLHSRFQARF
jgi:hypothetical protein